WTQPPRGWSERSVELGDGRGPLTLRFRSQSAAGDALGIALDWAEVQGAGWLWPAPSVLGGLALLFLAAPLLLALLAGRPAGLLLGWTLAVTGPLAVLVDRLGGLLALATAGVSAVGVAILVGLAARVLTRRRPETASPWSAGVAAALSVLALVALSAPFYFY